ncbi:MAG: hypothetical protein QM690_12835, partial [Sphingobium sp.]
LEKYMGRQRFTPEQIIAKLREVEVLVGRGSRADEWRVLARAVIQAQATERLELVGICLMFPSRKGAIFLYLALRSGHSVLGLTYVIAL